MGEAKIFLWGEGARKCSSKNLGLCLLRLILLILVGTEGYRNIFLKIILIIYINIWFIFFLFNLVSSSTRGGQMPGSPFMVIGVCISQIQIQKMTRKQQMPITIQSASLKKRDHFGRRRHAWKGNIKLDQVCEVVD
jgi:hypothetical protein